LQAGHRLSFGVSTVGFSVVISVSKSVMPLASH
jgi:hypothetical protein